MSESGDITLINASVTETHLVVELSDGRELATPIAWYPRLVGVSVEELRDFEVSSDGMHWEKLDEDLSLEGMLAGRQGRSSVARNSPPQQVGSFSSKLPDQTLIEIARDNGGVDFPALIGEDGQ